MFNHHYEKIGQTYWKYVDTEEAFVVKAQTDIPVGDTVRAERVSRRYARITGRSRTIGSCSSTGF